MFLRISSIYHSFIKIKNTIIVFICIIVPTISSVGIIVVENQKHIIDNLKLLNL